MIGEREQLQGRATVTTKSNKSDDPNERPWWKLYLSTISKFFGRFFTGGVNYYEGAADKNRNEADKLKTEGQLMAQQIAQSASEVDRQGLENLETEFKLIDEIKKEEDPTLKALKYKMLLKRRPEIKELIEELNIDAQSLMAVNFCKINLQIKKELKLTIRQNQILELIGKSYNNKEIAEQLFISQFTVATHRKNMMEKLNLKGRDALLKYALNRGYGFD